MSTPATAAVAPVTIRDRVKELRRVRASALRPHPHNWRTHGKAQRAALAGVLSEIGYADAVLAREVIVPGVEGVQLELIDGHLRAETTPDMLVPVLVLDVDEKEGPYAEFRDAVEQALASAEARDVALIGQAAQKEWQAAAWRLERRTPDRWGRKTRHELTTSGQGGSLEGLLAQLGFIRKTRDEAAQEAAGDEGEAQGATA